MGKPDYTKFNGFQKFLKECRKLECQWRQKASRLAKESKQRRKQLRRCLRQRKPALLARCSEIIKEQKQITKRLQPMKKLKSDTRKRRDVEKAKLIKQRTAYNNWAR